jgi:hypothetical protein
MSSSAQRRLLAAALVAGLAIGPVLSACSDDESPSGSAATTTPEAGANPLLPPVDPAQALPPDDVTTVRRFYEPVLAPLGLTLTRAALIDRSNGGYEPSPNGTHFALYVEPTRPFTDEEFVQNLWTLSAEVTPDVFARWSGLVSYDICQEPNPGEDDRPEPFPITQLDLTREGSAQVDWVNGDLVDLLVASRTIPDFAVRVKRSLRESPAYVAASDAADRQIAASGGTTIPSRSLGTLGTPAD